MKKLNKILALLLALVMVLALAACGGTPAASDGGASTDDSSAGDTTDAADAGDAEAGDAGDADAGAESTDSEIPENEVTGDPGAEGAFVIWGWNTDFVTLQGLLAEQYPEMADRIVFVNAGGSGFYQDKIDQLLADPSNELYPPMSCIPT